MKYKPLINFFKKVKGINKYLNSLFKSLAVSVDRPIVVTFTGGMGAQIISAAIYFYYKNEGKEVYADLSYFSHSEHVATEGKKGDVSYWGWQLQHFKLYPESFKTHQASKLQKYHLIKDGAEKLSTGIMALGKNSVQEYFKVDELLGKYLPLEIYKDYVCVHIRRGDYVNVASHVIKDSTFIELTNRLAGLLSSIVIISDSPIDLSFRREICISYQNPIFLDNIDAVAAHCVMRNASVLVCSNSQFSLIAAILNKRALVFLPKKWFGFGHHKLELPISKLCNFQVMT